MEARAESSAQTEVAALGGDFNLNLQFYFFNLILFLFFDHLTFEIEDEVPDAAQQ